MQCALDNINKTHTQLRGVMNHDLSDHGQTKTRVRRSLYL